MPDDMAFLEHDLAVLKLDRDVDPSIAPSVLEDATLDPIDITTDDVARTGGWGKNAQGTYDKELQGLVVHTEECKGLFQPVSGILCGSNSGVYGNRNPSICHVSL